MRNPTPPWVAALATVALSLSACTQLQNPSPNPGVARAQAVAYTFYAAPNGSGSSCSSSAPCSLAGARDRVRAVGSAAGDVVVNLAGGTYALGNTLAFTDADSGQNGNTIIWQAASGATPVLSGGQTISGWSLYDSAKNIYRASVGNLRFRQLYVGGVRAIRARAPNLTDPTTGGPYNRGYNVNPPYTIDAAQIGNWQNFSAVELVWLSHWKHKRARLSNYSVNGSTATLTLQSPEQDSQLLDSSYQDPFYYYLENAYELLDAEGEWYLNPSDNYLYYKPRAGENLNSITTIAPKVEHLVTLTGTTSSPVKNLTFKGITFAYDNWLLPNSVGFLDPQASTYIENGSALPNIAYSAVPGAVQVSNAQNLRFESNTFTHTAAHGLAFFDSTSANTVVGNTFNDLGANGVSFFCAAVCSGDAISNNLVDGFGQTYTGSVGIFGANVTGWNIVHNEVRNGFYSGISIGWAWDDLDRGMANNQVQYNQVHDVMRLHDDGGGIYTLARMSSTRIHDNYIYNLPVSSYQGGFGIAGIYLDQGSSLKTVDQNVIDAAPSAFYAVNAPNHDNLIQNNYYSGSLGSIAAGNTVQNNVNSVSAQAALDIRACAGIESAWGGSVPSTCASGAPGGGSPGGGGGLTGDKRLINKRSGAVLHNTGNIYNNVSGAYRVAATPASWNMNEQIWTISDAGNGYYRLTNKQWGTVLHNTGDLYNNASGVYEIAATPSSWNMDAQLWSISDAGGGYYKLTNKAYGTVLHNAGDLYNNAAGVYRMAATPASWNMDEQLWQITSP